MERKKRLLSIAKVVLFLAVALLIFFHVGKRLETGYGKAKFYFRDFYDADADEVDVVYIGASSASWNWNPMLAYRDNGVASQLLASENLPPDALPYLIREASAKSPRLYIIDTLRFLGQTSNKILAAQAVLMNMRISPNYFDAADDLLENYSAQEKTFKYSPFMFFHDRWDQLNQNDFQPAENDFMGYHVSALKGDKMPLTEEEANEVSQTVTLDEEYLQIIDHVLEACAEVDGQVLFIVPPNEWLAGDFLAYIEGVVTEAGFDYLNASACLDEIGIEEGDFEGSTHLTVYGAEKYTAWLSEYIQETYDLPDHREDRDFREAERYEEAYEDYREYVIRNGEMFNQYLSFIADPRYSVLVAARDEASSGLSEENREKLRALGLEASLEDAFRSSYIAVIDQGELVLERLTEADSTESLFEKGTLKDGTPYFIFSAGYSAGEQSRIIVGGVDYSVNRRGLNFVVYDNEKHTVIDSVVFDTYSTKLSANREAPELSEYVSNAENLSEPVPDGANQYTKGVITFKGYEQVYFDELQYAGGLNISVGANDTYVVLIYNNSLIVDAAVIPLSDPDDLSLRAVHIVLSDEAREVGYNSVILYPSGGDKSYHIGHLIPEEP